MHIKMKTADKVLIYSSVSQPPVRGQAAVRVYFSVGPPNEFQYYITINSKLDFLL